MVSDGMGPDTEDVHLQIPQNLLIPEIKAEIKVFYFALIMLLYSLGGCQQYIRYKNK